MRGEDQEAGRLTGLRRRRVAQRSQKRLQAVVFQFAAIDLRRELERLDTVQQDDPAFADKHLGDFLSGLVGVAAVLGVQRQAEMAHRLVEEPLAVGGVLVLALAVERPVQRLDDIGIVGLPQPLQPVPDQRRFPDAAVRRELQDLRVALGPGAVEQAALVVAALEHGLVGRHWQPPEGQAWPDRAGGVV